MVNSGWMRRAVATMGLAAVAMLSTACGEMTTRTWINIVPEDSGGTVTIYLGPNPLAFDLLRLQGGFLAEVKLNTLDLPGPMNGTILLQDVRMAGEIDGLLGKMCTWNDPTGSSTGELVVDLLGGTTTSSLYLDAKASTAFSDALGIGAVDFEQAIDFDLGEGLGIDTFINTFLEGSPAGMFNAETVIASEINMAGIRSVFEMRTAIANGTLPPIFDDDLLAHCEDQFALQGLGYGTFYGVNSKSSYLRLNPKDQAKDPLVIDLAEIGAQHGDTLRIDTVGSWAIIPFFKDGPEVKAGAVFSATDELLPGSELFLPHRGRDRRGGTGGSQLPLRCAHRRVPVLPGQLGHGLRCGASCEPLDLRVRRQLLAPAPPKNDRPGQRLRVRPLAATAPMAPLRASGALSRHLCRQSPEVPRLRLSTRARHDLERPDGPIQRGPDRAWIDQAPPAGSPPTAQNALGKTARSLGRDVFPVFATIFLVADQELGRRGWARGAGPPARWAGTP